MSTIEEFEKGMKWAINEFNTKRNNESVHWILYNLAEAVVTDTAVLTKIDPNTNYISTITNQNGTRYYTIFTSAEESNKFGNRALGIYSLEGLIQLAIEDSNVEGIVFNPATENFILPSDTSELVLEAAEQRRNMDE